MRWRPNSGNLVTQNNGTEVGWDSSGTPGGAVIDTQSNNATGFLTALKDQNVIAGPTHP